MITSIPAVSSITPPSTVIATAPVTSATVNSTIVAQPSTIVSLGNQPDPAIFANPGMTAAQMYATIQNLVATNIAYQGLGSPVPVTDGTNTNALIAALGDISKLSDKQIAALIILLTEEQQMNDTGIGINVEA